MAEVTHVPASVEVWKPVPIEGFKDIYSVSDHGRVRSEPRVVTQRTGRRYAIAGRVLRYQLGGSRYRFVTLVDTTRSGKRAVNVHTLVAAAFIGPRPDGAEVCHQDGNPFNNKSTNLYYGTHSQNMRDMVRHGRFRNQHTKACTPPYAPSGDIS